ncbi:hypothetical protein [Pseudomonas syringae]|uniref:hypothetical protein n=1 Tax=Pseudomonas syringae TaxID=317 RepID=UPI0013041D4C|nr:hypothetical protein [Pseudomonas syringae]
MKDTAVVIRQQKTVKSAAPGSGIQKNHLPPSQGSPISNLQELLMLVDQEEIGRNELKA